MLFRTGLTLYAVLAGCRRYTGFRTLGRRVWRQLDGLSTSGLRTVFSYWDAQADDAALTRAVMRSAESLGAMLCCPAEFSGADVTADGCVVRFRIGLQEQVVQSHVLVNAAGPWATAVVQRILPRPPAPMVECVQGTHLELPGRIARGCYYVEAPQDRRAVFVMPWRGRTLLGTTELPFSGTPEQSQPTSRETEYLLDVYRHFFPGRSREVLQSWAGLRVLPTADSSPAFGRSRETQLPVNDLSCPRVLSIFGGKLTGYRTTAEKVIRKLEPALPQRQSQADTRTLPLSPD